MSKELEEIKADAIIRADNLLNAWANPAMGMLLGMTGHPLLGVAWLAAFGAFTYTSTATTKKLDKFIELLREGKFNEEDLQTEGFCEGLNVLFEAFMKARNEIKINIIRRILLGFSSTEDRQKFHLERLCHDTNTISLETLNFLVFLKNKVIPAAKEKFIETWSDTNPNEKEKWFKYEPIEPPIGKYLQKYDPNNSEACKEYGYDPTKSGPDGDPSDQGEIVLRMWRDQRYKRAEFDDAISELVGMGILRDEMEAPGYANDPVHFLTEYGIEFINYIFDEDLRSE